MKEQSLKIFYNRIFEIIADLCVFLAKCIELASFFLIEVKIVTNHANTTCRVIGVVGLRKCRNIAVLLL